MTVDVPEIVELPPMATSPEKVEGPVTSRVPATEVFPPILASETVVNIRHASNATEVIICANEVIVTLSASIPNNWYIPNKLQPFTIFLGVQ